MSVMPPAFNPNAFNPNAFNSNAFNPDAFNPEASNPDASNPTASAPPDVGSYGSDEYKRGFNEGKIAGCAECVDRTGAQTRAIRAFITGAQAAIGRWQHQAFGQSQRPPVAMPKSMIGMNEHAQW